MYRLTIYGPLVEQVRESLKAKQTVSTSWTTTWTTTWTTMYRWGNKWGEYSKEHDEWSCEIRTLLACDTNENKIVLEKVEQVECFAPPYDIDDMWEEEVVKRGNITCGNLLVIKGSNTELHSLCNDLIPSLSKWLTEYVNKEIPKEHIIQPQAKPTVYQKKQPRFEKRSVCLIENY